MLKTLAFAAGLALVASAALRAAEGDVRAVVHAGTLIRGVPIPSPFKGTDGKSQPPGVYDVSVRQAPQGILIALLRNGKPVAEVPGRFFHGVVNRLSAGGKMADPPGGSQAHDISIRTAGGMQDIHFDASSKVSFGGGGGAGRISCSNDLHPGGANLGSISFQLPAVSAPVK